MDAAIQSVMSLTQQGPLAAAPKPTTIASKADAAAKDYEAVFISQFLGSMFSGIKSDGITGGGQGEEMFRSLMVDQYAKSIVQRGGFGIADHMKAALLKHQQVFAVKDDSRIERLIALAERIIAALESDIAILKDGGHKVLATADPEIQKLTALYGREAHGFDVRIAQSAPPTLRQRFFVITAKFREALQRHARMVTRVKNASEGLIRAIATEVERANAPARTYGPRPGCAPKSSGAMVFNRVV